MPHLMSLLAAFVAVSVAMGVLAAGLLMPAVGAAGSLSNKSINAFDNIDKTWTTTALAQQSKVLDADNKVIATPYDQNRIIVKLSKVAPIMQQAQVAIEDSRFFDHGALDIRGTARAFFNNAAGNSTQGGSSLTQQFVKMTLQYEALKKGDEQAALDAIDVNYGRKLREMALAMQVEKEMTKRQILQGYLNLAYYGDQAYGIEAAALHYFDVHASQLNLTQSATLAGVVQSPSNSDPHNYPEAAQKRRDVVLDRMAQLGIISAAESAAAKKPSIKSLLRIRDSEGGTCDRSSQPYFCNYVIAYLKTLKVLGKNEDERTLAINRGGLTIKTTIKSDWQQQILVDLRSRVPAGDPSGIGAAAAVVEPGTGKVLATWGGQGAGRGQRCRLEHDARPARVRQRGVGPAAGPRPGLQRRRQAHLGRHDAHVLRDVRPYAGHAHGGLRRARRPTLPSRDPVGWHVVQLRQGLQPARELRREHRAHQCDGAGRADRRAAGQPPGMGRIDRADEGVLTATFDLEFLRRHRAAWGFFRDRRTEFYR